MIQKIRIYDNPAYRTFSWGEINTTDVDGVSYSSPLITKLITPGTLIDGVYRRTDLTILPEEIRTLAGACWSENSYTQHEEFLRSQ